MAREFNLRMEAQYGKDNAVDELKVETLVDSDWQALGLNERTPGFLVFVYAILNCQHTFLCGNGMERGLMFRSSKGSLYLQADDDWHLVAMRLHFDVQLESGIPAEGDAEHIIARMEACPVSRNLPPTFEVMTTVSFHS